MPPVFTINLFYAFDNGCHVLFAHAATEGKFSDHAELSELVPTDSGDPSAVLLISVELLRVARFPPPHACEDAAEHISSLVEKMV